MVVSYTVLPHAQSRQTLRAWGFFIFLKQKRALIRKQALTVELDTPK
ncbi:hypothetical protein HMPREF0841_0771 [Streptococcus pyogenes ATCC 10782]|nr:hypothetical protein HMPREF0841_0771 [Streptococcus pyogenes ATCC 10782]ESA56511.1 hypothetical protein HMPREF1238_0976 [Streptococcus pyogenes GA40377]